MYYELIILGTLMAGPSHGYLIAKIIQNISGPHGKLSPGRLYPLLTRLEQGELIVAEAVADDHEDRRSRRSPVHSRRYGITEAGRARFRALMLDTTSYPGDYPRVFVQKVAYFSFLDPAERLRLTEHYRDYCRTQVTYGAARAAALGDAGGDAGAGIGLTGAQRADLLTAMRHTIDRWHQEHAWAERLGAEITAGLAAPDAAPDGREERR